MNKRMGIYLALISLLFVNGCAVMVAGSAGAGTVAYIKGELQATLDMTLEKSIEATNEALTRLEFIKISQKSDQLTGEIIARTAQDKKITTKLSKLTASTTQLTIRIGVFGDQTISQRLLEEITASGNKDSQSAEGC